jgi:hypothetical protein
LCCCSGSVSLVLSGEGNPKNLRAPVDGRVGVGFGPEQAPPAGAERTPAAEARRMSALGSIAALRHEMIDLICVVLC